MEQITNNFNSKSILAKLLAEENISILHKNVQTACFDLETRTMILPIWKEMTGEMYDLLTAHEIGHAQETPPEGWHSAVFSPHSESNPNAKPRFNAAFKSYLNVIEDARIEKLMKRRYPGLSKSFAKGYRLLQERDFFGISGIDVNNLKLIDRINIKFKMGSFIPVRFSEEEQVFVDEVANLETWEQVLDLSKRLYARAKAEAKKSEIWVDADLDQLTEALKQLEIEDSEEVGAHELDGPLKDFDDLSNDSFEEGDEDEEDEEVDEDEEDWPEHNDEELEDDGSETDNFFRGRESELVNTNDNVVVIELPEANLENIIVPNSIVISMLDDFLKKETQISYAYSSRNITYPILIKNCKRRFFNRNNRYIMHLVKEFESRKNANSYSRRFVSKTGELDTNLLHKYKFTNDIFKKITITPKSKSHGIVMFLDMSDSMRPIFSNTLEQVLVLVSFCQKVNIPFDVYGFTSSRLDKNEQYNLIIANQNKFKLPDGFVIHGNGNFHLKHLISSSLDKNVYKKAFDILCVAINEYPKYNYHIAGFGNFSVDWSAAGFNLGNTPLISTLLSSRKIIANFNSKHGTDITNVLYLTDGSPTDKLEPVSGAGILSYRTEVILIDKTTKLRTTYSKSAQYEALNELIRRVTGCKHIGYYLLQNNSAVQNVLYGNKMQIAAAKTKLKQDHFYSLKANGFDEYFLVKINSTNNSEKLNVDSNMTKASLASRFKQFQKGKTNSRIMVAKFAESLANSL